MEEYLKEINERIYNPSDNINSVKGFEIISESLVYKVFDVFGRNSLLSILYQTGVHPGTIIAERIKREYGKEDFEIMEALVILMDELKEFYSIQLRDIEQYEDRYRIIIENHCFLRNPISNREKLDFGKAFCRINKGYFETAFKKLLGEKIKKIEINYLENDSDKDVCVEEINFYI
ncbi:MAG: hypothetical protein JSV62_14735 [Promethearchaeota archaeon]|nr:MAG: hypothetical protein JSV62_14735 [Candidatus Lokiarchaeota archaeon]